MIIKYILPLKYSTCESNFVPWCSQPCTAWLCCGHPPVVLPRAGIATHHLSAPTVGKETGWARLHFPSALLTCGSPDSPRKASSQSKAFVCVATGYQKGKAEGKGCSRERIFLCPSWRKREEEVAACSCSLRRFLLNPHWALTTCPWRLLRGEDPFPPALEPHWPLIQKAWQHYDIVYEMKYCKRFK